MSSAKKLFFLGIVLCVLLSPSLTCLAVNPEPSWVMWSKTYGGADAENTSSMVEIVDGYYVILADRLLLKIDANGNMEWNQTISQNENDLTSMLIQANDGGFVIAGNTYSYGAGLSDFWLVKTDSTGNVQWNQTYGTEYYERALALTQTFDGGYALVGEAYDAGENALFVKTDGSGNMVWNKTYSVGTANRFTDVIQTVDGGFVLVGSTNPVGGDRDGWITKLNFTGGVEWSHTFDLNDNDYFNKIIQTTDGKYTIAGSTNSFESSQYDFWLAKLDTTGYMLWNQTYGGPRDDQCSSVIQTSDGGYALAGSTTSYGYGNSDVWLVKTDDEGNMQWTKNYGGERNDRAAALLETSDGGYILVCSTESFGTESIDVWVFKTNIQGVPEFPTWLVLPILASVTAVAFFYKKKLAKTPNWR
ncbi:MAG: hypothetical protein WC325_02140 [Candidatus Bathyarchaeia archaeon]